MTRFLVAGGIPKPSLQELVISRLLFTTIAQPDPRVAVEIGTLLINEVLPRVYAEANVVDDEVIEDSDLAGNNFNLLAYMDEYHYGLERTVAELATLKHEGFITTRHVRQLLDLVMSPKCCCWDLIDVITYSKVLEEAEGDELLLLVQQLLKERPEVVADVKKGKDKAVGSLIGPVLKKLKADPSQVRQLFLTEIAKLP